MKDVAPYRNAFAAPLFVPWRAAHEADSGSAGHRPIDAILARTALPRIIRAIRRVTGNLRLIVEWRVSQAGVFDRRRDELSEKAAAVRGGR